ncbi:MAG: alpha/beta hydrolase [Vicinamibacteria bacterium]
MAAGNAVVARSRGRTLLKSLVRITLGVAVGATLFLLIFEKHLIYYPATVLDITPAALSLPSEEVWLDVEPGVKIHGWFIKAAHEPAVATVLFSHGNAGNIADRLDRVASLRELNVDFLLYDYRGFGRSTGDPDEEGTYRDGRAAYDYLTKTKHVDPGALVLMGESLGCAISVQLAMERKAAGLILEAPFASIARMAASIYPYLPLGSFVRTRYDNLEKIPRLKMPLLVTQGTRDEVIPTSQGRLVFEAAPKPKRFLSIEGAHHNDVYVVGAGRYRDALREFIAGAARSESPSGLVETEKP